MAAGPSIDVSGWLEEQLAQASPDLLRPNRMHARLVHDHSGGGRRLKRLAP
jgi:hypothetical protein